MKHILSIAGVLLAASALTGADVRLRFSPPLVLSQEGTQVPGGAVPGENGSKVRLATLTKTPGGTLDGRLVAIYADASHPGALVWDPQTELHLASDIFVRVSDDQGATWTNPLDLSHSASFYSAVLDWDGSGIPSPCWGDCDKPTVFSNGANIVVSWVGKYAPEPGWSFGGVGQSTIQGSSVYPDPDVPTGQRVIPFSAVYVAISIDGGTSWTYGDGHPPMQVTFGRRDALGDVNRGIGNRWILTWQEDPLGLQPGEAEGPGEGSSGARVSKGTDVWYSFTKDLTTTPLTLCASRTPLSDHSVYDVTDANGFTMVGDPGTMSVSGASRCNTSMVKVGSQFLAVMAYEATKDLPELESGKTVQYHVFPFDAPPANGPDTARYGDAGVTLSDAAENSRRVRFITQGVNGVDPAIVIFWRQGEGTRGAPADIMVKVSTAVDGASLLAAPTVDLTSDLPHATAANLADTTGRYPLENALAHRGFLRGSAIVLGASYTPDGQLAEETDLANYNFYIRRSLDGGLTWLPAQNVTRITDTKINVKEPRIVTTPNTGNQNGDVFVVAWATETNVYAGLGEPESLDVYVRRSANLGRTYQETARLGSKVLADYETQLNLNEAGDRIFVVWNSGAAPSDALFSTGVPVHVYGGGCVARPDGAADPALLLLAVGGTILLVLRARRASAYRSSE